jgi:phosphoglycerate dehydrogenase-like enzyme
MSEALLIIEEPGVHDLASCVVAVLGASADSPPPGLAEPPSGCDLRFISARENLSTDAADADAVFAWTPRLDWIAAEWGWSKRLRWIASSTVGVDWLLFPELVCSDVVVTNSAGVFNEAMAEYALALVSAVCADLHTTLRLQHARLWQHRETTRLAGRRIVVVGAGGIGRATARLLTRTGAIVTCVGRHRREDPELGTVPAVTQLPSLLPAADFVILVLPLTEDTRGLFGAEIFTQMRSDAWLINLGRGAIVEEPALISALRSGMIAGAALDVFADEPLPAQSPLWSLPNVIVSPHMSADFYGWEGALTGLFLDQLRRFRASEPLVNVVDKELGFVPGINDMPPAPGEM